MKILGIGIATLDIVNLIEEYPAENSEIRATGQRISRGGNATNTLVTLSQLGDQCSWGGVVSSGPESQMILSDLRRYGIDTKLSVTHPGVTPTSYIALSRKNGSRSIIHYRDLAEYSADDFSSIDLSPFDWIHFEGRNVADLGVMLQRVKDAGIPCSLEVEKPRKGIEALFSLPDLLLFSSNYALHRGFTGAEAFLYSQQEEGAGNVRVCAWGDQGAWAFDRANLLHHSPAFQLIEVVDTLGAGDVFNAGMIHGLASGRSLAEALCDACRLAGRKCGLNGFDFAGQVE